MSNKISRWYNTFGFRQNMEYMKDDELIKKLIENIEYTCNKSNYIITLLTYYNSLDKYNRNILHYLHIYNLTDSLLYKYVKDNNYAYDFYVDIFGKKPSDYDNILENINNDILLKSFTLSPLSNI